MRQTVLSLCAGTLLAPMFATLVTVAPPLSAQTAPTVPKRTSEQIEASFDAHQAEFDYLLGDWEFTSVSKEFGKGRGYWSATRLMEARFWTSIVSSATKARRST